MASREDVIVRFGGDATALQGTLGAIRSGVQGLGSAIGQLGAGIGLAGVAAKIQETMGWADDLANTANRVGMTTEAVQSLRLAADHYGVSQEQVDSALDKFSVNLAKARQGTGDLRDTLAAYGIKLTDANKQLRSNSDVFEDYVRVLQRMGNEAERERIISVGLGDGALKMGQALAESGKSVAQLTGEMENLGLVMSGNDVAKIAEIEAQYTVAMQRMGVASRNFFGGAIAGWQEMWDIVTQGMDDATVRLGVDVKLFDMTRAIEDQKAQMRALSDGWIESLFSEEQKSAAQKKQREILKALEDDRERYIAELASKRAAERKDAAKPGDDKIAPKPVKGAADAGKDVDRAIDARKAAREKELSDTRQQVRAEGDIWRALAEERAALAAKQQERANEAQRKQEEALRRLIGTKASDEKLRQYDRLVNPDKEPEIHAKLRMTLSKEDLASMPASIQSAIEGGNYDVTLKAQVVPELLMGSMGQVGTLAQGNSAETAAAREADQTGAR